MQSNDQDEDMLRLVSGHFSDAGDFSCLVESACKSMGDILSEDSTLDTSYLLDFEGRSFSRWLWSSCTHAFGTHASWSAVVAGNRIDDDGRMFIATEVFLFHSTTGERLVCRDGRSYVKYQLESNGISAEWRLYGWQHDEFDEWSSLTTIDPIPLKKVRDADSYPPAE